ncbi:MAG: phosphoribosylformylglycinamidine cyclo-ligase [Candidatus Margulisiibacteriota bacterium]
MATYKQSGVDIEAGYEVVSRVKRLAKSTRIPGVLGEIGLFGGCFELDPKRVLVSGTDGVGTKLKLAFDMNRHDTVGIDLVAMNADDVVCAGARPLFFLDYIGAHKVNPDLMEQILTGIAKGCKLAGCALIGGETAELTDLYAPGEYDLAGFACGVVEKKKLITGAKIKPGDKILGLASSGLHSNGFSLARRVFFKEGGLSVTDRIKGLEKPLGEELLTPTRIYTQSLLSLINKIKVKGLAHITGGGLPENIGRILPKGTKAVIEKMSFKKPTIFGLLQLYGKIGVGEMYKAFNMGIGMAIVISSKDLKKSLKILNDCGEKVFLIGEIAKGQGQVEIN